MKLEKLHHTDEETEYRFYDQSGDACLEICKVFNGVEVICNSVHLNFCNLAPESTGNLIEIHHCCKGRLEYQHGDELVYLMPGDFSISRRREKENICFFPLRHYHGITIIINEDTAPECFSCFLKDVNVQPVKVADKLCGKNGCFIIRNQSYIEHIFSELYSVPATHKKGFYKIKILELLFVLSWIDPAENGITSVSLPKAQVQLAKKAAEYLAQKMDQHITLEQLAGIFHVSRAHLCNAFKGVYGVPVYTYIRIQKMQAAALQLIHTDRAVIDIAVECGYDNPSKFASSFKEIMGETPLEYRRAHSIPTELI